MPSAESSDGSCSGTRRSLRLRRPLAIRKDGTWYAYGWDLTGNVTEIFGKAGYLRTVYTYTPYGEAAAEGDVTQPIQWSSEYSDEELGLVYYNYRHLNPHDGRWISRDPIEEQGGWNLFAFVNNNGIINIDLLGLLSFMSCVRFPDLSMICLISIFEGLCVCPECKKIADKKCIRQNLSIRFWRKEMNW